MDVNEKIAKAYFEEVHGYVVKTNHYFKKKREKGTGPSDIDLILMHPEEGRFGKKAICSVKGWQSHKIPLKDIKNKEIFDHKWKIFEKDELIAAENFFKDSDFNKILILPPIRNKDKLGSVQYCKKEYGIELLDFSDILFELINYLSCENRIYRSYDSEFLQTLRIILVNLCQMQNKELVLQPNIIDFLGLTKENVEDKFCHNKLKIYKKSA